MTRSDCFFNDDKIACLLLKRGKIPKSFCNNGSFYDDLAKFSWGPWHENFAQSLLQFLVCGPHGDPNETLSEVCMILYKSFRCQDLVEAEQLPFADCSRGF